MSTIESPLATFILGEKAMKFTSLPCNTLCSVAAAIAVVVPTGQSAQAELVYGVRDNQTLVSFDSSTPSTLLSGAAISGLQQNETITGIDFRPATGELYAAGSFSNLYTLDVGTGAATLVGAGSFTPALNGSSFGFDFNPVIDRIRDVSDVNKNYVLNPNDGTATEVTDLFYGSGDVNEGTDPNVVHSAYTNSVSGATSTQLYGIDTGLDLLVTQANSAGTLASVGTGIGVDITDIGGFDISGATGIAYLAVKDVDSAKTMFWTIDLTSGIGINSAIGGNNEVGGGAVLTAIAVVPEPTTAMIFAAPALGLLRRRLRAR